VALVAGEHGRDPRPSGGGVSPFRDGGDFIFTAAADVPALWGEGRDVLWSAGEALLLGRASSASIQR